MPLVRIDLPAGQPPEQLAALGDAVHQSLVATFNVPPDDRFQVITEHPAGRGLVVSPGFLGIAHTAQAVIVQITAAAGRSNDQKRALYREIARRAADTGVVSAADVIINLVEVNRVDWSFGSGIAQYVPAG